MRALTMKTSILAGVLTLAVVWGFTTAPQPAAAGEASSSDYKVLAPIRQGNLTIFPVVAGGGRDTKDFLTLDEGLRSGDVVVTESGGIQPLVRGRNRPVPVHDGRTGEPARAGEQLKAPASIASGGNRHRREAGSRNRQRPHRSRRERAD